MRGRMIRLTLGCYEGCKKSEEFTTVGNTKAAFYDWMGGKGMTNYRMTKTKPERGVWNFWERPGGSSSWMGLYGFVWDKPCGERIHPYPSREGNAKPGVVAVRVCPAYSGLFRDNLSAGGDEPRRFDRMNRRHRISMDWICPPFLLRRYRITVNSFPSTLS